MIKKEMIAMLLAGGQGSRLGVLTEKVAKPAVAFGGKYRIIDFPLSNCINSGIDTVGVLTQYQPLRLNQHIGIGIPWDLDKKNGGVTILAPHVKGGDSGEWFMGTANAIYQNIDFIDSKYFGRLVGNTLKLSLYNLIFGFWIPIVFALLLNEIRQVRLRKFFQTASYLPYFISMVVVAGLVISFLETNGLVNNIIAALGGERQAWRTNKEAFPGHLYHHQHLEEFRV